MPVADTHDHTDKNPVGRRDFFKGAALGAAGLVVTVPEASASTPAQVRPGAVLPSSAAVQAEFAGAAVQAPAASGSTETVTRPASDYMVDVLKKLDLEYAAINPGSAFAGLHESLLNYGNNTAPELLTCLHEESAMAMAHGYAKAAGKPMLVCVHGVVGLLHSSMALFQAWADRMPILVIVGHHRNPAGVINRPHSAQDMGSLVRDFVKFDDEATTLERFAESAMQAYRIAMTPPRGPVVLVVDAALQESRIPDRARPRIPILTMASPPQGDAAAVREAARLLVSAETPLIQTQKMGFTPKGWDLSVELAELLQAPVIDMGGRLNFPWRHPLNASARRGAVLRAADVVLALEVQDLVGAAAAATKAIRAMRMTIDSSFDALIAVQRTCSGTR